MSGSTTKPARPAALEQKTAAKNGGTPPPRPAPANPGPPPNPSQARGRDVVSYTAAEVGAAPGGPWAVDVYGFGDETSFEVVAEFGEPAPALDAGDRAALQDVVKQCCPGAGACAALKAALQDGAPDLRRALDEAAFSVETISVLAGAPRQPRPARPGSLVDARS